MNNYIGVGIGLRRKHFRKAIENPSQVDWYEILVENYMNFGGRPIQVLQELLNLDKPLIPHGVCLSLGDINPIDNTYIDKLEKLVKLTNPLWFSDHLCFSSNQKIHYHDLLPVLRTQESLDIICDKINFLQDKFSIPFALENISYYVETTYNKISEIDFINAIVEKTNCRLLLDVNNVYVNSKNFNFNAIKYIESLPIQNIIQIHLAGHSNDGPLIIDTHGDYVANDVWNLFEQTLQVCNRPISTLIEWDSNIPSFEVLVAEADKARKIIKNFFFNEANLEA